MVTFLQVVRQYLPWNRGAMLYGVDVSCSNGWKVSVFAMAKDGAQASKRAWNMVARQCGKGAYPMGLGEPWVSDAMPDMGYAREGIQVKAMSPYADKEYWRKQADGCLKRIGHAQAEMLCREGTALRAYLLLGLCGAFGGCLHLDADLYVKAMGLSRADAMGALDKACKMGLLSVKRYVGDDGMESRYVTAGGCGSGWLTEGPDGHGLNEAAEFGWETYLRDRLSD